MERKRSNAYTAFGVLTAVAVVALIGAGFLIFEAVRDRVLGDETPQTVTADGLLANGAGANRHVTMTEFAVGPDFVMVSGTAEKKNETYLVVSPPGVPPGTPGRSLVVHVTKFQDHFEAQDNPRLRAFTGFFTPAEHLPPAQKKMLGEKYPGLALDAVPYLEVREHKGTSGFRRASYFAGVGVPLLAVGVVGMVAVARRSPTRRDTRPAR
jgi:hypothetical protein